MMKISKLKWYIFTSVLLVLLALPMTSKDNLYQPTGYIKAKLQGNDIVYVPNKKLSIRQYIERQKPGIKMWSVGQLINQNPDGCDFTRRFSSLPDAVALDLDKRYRGWKLGLTGPIAIVPAECFELVDGLVIY